MKILNKIKTKHIWINPKKCIACGVCIAICPESVIGKAGFLWHKHIIIKKPDNCTGCKNCIRVCSEDVFSEKITEDLKIILAKRNIKY